MHPVVVSIESIPPEGKVIPLEYPEAEVSSLLSESELADARAAGAVSGEASIMASGHDIFVLGKLTGRFGYSCVRCLEPFEKDLAADFHLVYTREAEEGTGEIELHRQDLDIEVLGSSTLNLTRVVEEQLVLALEPHPVCREACLGLCPGCGGNRNMSECTCEAPAVDPRFAALATLRTKLMDSGKED